MIETSDSAIAIKFCGPDGWGTLINVFQRIIKCFQAHYQVFVSAMLKIVKHHKQIFIQGTHLLNSNTSEKERERERDSEREGDRQTDRHRQTDRQRNRQTDRQRQR